MSQEKHLLLEKDSREKVGGGTTTTSVSAIWRSFFFLTIGAFLSFCAYNGSQNIVSSLKMKSVQGSTAVAILYLFFTFFCLLAPFIVQKVGAKNVLMLQLLFLTLYTLSFISECGPDSSPFMSECPCFTAEGRATRAVCKSKEDPRLSSRIRSTTPISFMLSEIYYKLYIFRANRFFEVSLFSAAD